ncbi:MAG: DUF4890 domain-containing protein [Tannerella sp.]|jgi:hypothetical protein|nr:DUF4890 domain-containing protein [Tannerella sp.]
MKKIFVIAVCIVATLITATAQQQRGRNSGTPEERAKNQTTRLDSLVNLTADQKTKIEAINLDLSKKMSEIFQSTQGDRDKMRSKMDELATERDKQYKAILTDDQYKKYLNNREQLRERQGGRRRN